MIHPVQITPEYKLLLAAAVRVGTSTERPPFDSRLQWDRLLELALHHRLACLTDKYVAAHPDRGRVPAWVRQRLETERQRAAASNLLRRRELDELAATLAGQSIPVMALKGLALIESVYVDIGSRPMDDIDLLVPVDRIDEAYSLLSASGYRPLPADRSKPPAIQGHWHYRKLIHERGHSSVELHRHVANGCPNFSIGDFFRRARPSERGPYSLPEAADLMLHGALHFTWDRRLGSWRALGQLADLAWIAGSEEIAWDDLIDRARRYGVAGRLFVALDTLRMLEPRVVSSSVIDTLRPDSYRPALGERYVEQRVLVRQPWSNPWLHVTRDVFWSRTQQLTPGRTYLAEQYSMPGASALRLYGRRVAGALYATGKVVGSSLRRPQLVAGNLRLERWLASPEVLNLQHIPHERDPPRAAHYW